MAIGIGNATTITLDGILNITNSSSYPGFGAKVNHAVYGGWLYFIILITLLVILYFKLQSSRDQPLINIMYSSAFISIIALFLRAIEVTKHGVLYGMLTDYQMWIFPLIAICSATINWAIKNK